MATLKLTMDKRRAYIDGRYPIVIRLTSNSKSTFIHANVRLHEKNWDALKNKVTKVHPDRICLNSGKIKQASVLLKDEITAED